VTQAETNDQFRFVHPVRGGGTRWIEVLFRNAAVQNFHGGRRVPSCQSSSCLRLAFGRVIDVLAHKIVRGPKLIVWFPPCVTPDGRGQRNLKRSEDTLTQLDPNLQLTMTIESTVRLEGQTSSEEARAFDRAGDAF